MSLTKASYSLITGAPVNVKDFGAIGDGVADDTTAIQNAIDSISKGVLYFPEGTYKTTATISVENKNDSTLDSLEISAYGAVINSTVTGSTPAFQILECKQLVISGLRVAAPSSSVQVNVRGMWKSTWNECFFGNVTFGAASGTMDEVYWSKFVKCEFGTVTINTNTAGDRREFNANTFDTCRFFGGDYALKKYGSWNIEDIFLINCDFSYQTTDVLYIDEPCFGTLTFFGGYFDSAVGFPKDTKNLQINIYGPVYNPLDGNIKSFYLGNGSGADAHCTGSSRGGRRNAMSAYNLIKNGDFGRGASDVTVLNASATNISSGNGVFGNYVQIGSSTAFGTAKFTTIPLPFTGIYSLTVIAKANAVGLSDITFDGVSQPISIGADWTVTSFTFGADQGDVEELVFTNGATGSMNYDIAYVGVTYGAVGQLYAPQHPYAEGGYIVRTPDGTKRYRIAVDNAGAITSTQVYS